MKSHESLIPTYIKNMLLVVMAINSKGKQWKTSMICTSDTMLLLADAISEFTNSSWNVMDFAWDIIWVHHLNKSWFWTYLRCRHLFFNKVRKAEFCIFPKDIIKPTTSIYIYYSYLNLYLNLFQ